MFVGWGERFSNPNVLHGEFVGVRSSPQSTVLTHSDPLSNASIYLSSSLSITAVPIPAALWLFISGLVGLGALTRRKA